MKIAVTGAAGLLGGALCPKLEQIGGEVITVGRSLVNSHQCDFSDLDAAKQSLDEIMPTIIINLVALTNVDQCESNPKEAFSINAKTVNNISQWIENSHSDCHLIHISTDQVYDGEGPHAEENVMPSNYYAYSKLLAESAASRVSSTVLRTNFLGKSNRVGRKSFTDWIFENALLEKPITLLSDVFFSPLSMQALVKVISQVAVEKPQGIFNLGSTDGMSKAEFGMAFLDTLNLSAERVSVKSISQVDFMKTHRPCDMRMNINKIQSRMGICLPTLKEEIIRIAGEHSG